MSCDSVEDLLGAWLDNELDATQSAEVAAHVGTCNSCTASLERLRQLSAAMRSPELTWQPPAYFEARVMGAVRDAARPQRSVRQPFWRWAALAACIVLGAAILWTTLPLRSPGSNTQLLAQEVVSSHVRSLLGSHLLDVPSTDQHTVKPWFDGKLDFSPDVKDLGNQGFRLIGGRLDYLGGRRVAALIFQHRLHMVNLFIWPSGQGDSSPQPEPGQKGYNLVHWNTAGVTYWAAADIPVAELEDFAQLYRK
jgi:anti-sigma factor RsiW